MTSAPLMTDIGGASIILSASSAIRRFECSSRSTSWRPGF
jgi:hypothetical protein